MSNNNTVDCCEHGHALDRTCVACGRTPTRHQRVPVSDPKTDEPMTHHDRRVRELAELEREYATKAAAHQVNDPSEFEERLLEHAFREAVQAGYELGAMHRREMEKEAEAQAEQATERWGTGSENGK